MYNDYPVLTNQDYLLISSQYNNVNYNRNKVVSNVFLYLQQAKNSCLNLSQSNNQAISKVLIASCETLNSVIENLSLVFNVNLQPTNQVKQLNLFQFLKYLNIATGNLLVMQQQEEQKHILTFTTKTANCLVGIIGDILNVLSTNNPRLYKYL